MDKQCLSVAMCTYNGAQYLSEQLESIASQSRLPDALVVCDDRSTDDTVEIIRTFACKLPFAVRLHINEETLGSTKNFEKAIKLCEGDIIALSDQDDVWLPNKLKNIESVLSASPGTGAVFTDAIVVDEYLQPLGYRLWQSTNFSLLQQRKVVKGRSLEVLLKHNVVTGATMAFRSEFKSLILPIPLPWVHDSWIALIIAVLADLMLIREPLILYRQHSRNQIGAKKGITKTAG
jgi:glycosyltransferase involved in cell wall biosynthesis